MSKFISCSDPKVSSAIQSAAKAACSELDAVFPGYDAGGITSNFQGLLVEVLEDMLKGHSPIVSRRMHTTSLARLVADEDFFGKRFVLNTEAGFAVVRRPEDAGGLVRQSSGVLALDGKVFRPIEKLSDAWTNFDSAGKAALEYCTSEQLTFDEAAKIAVVPVVFREGADSGYQLVEPSHAS